MKSDYMYSVGVVYNTLPTPTGWADNDKLERRPSSNGDSDVGGVQTNPPVNRTFRTPPETAVTHPAP